MTHPGSGSFRNSSVFFGPTNFSAVFSEYHENIEDKGGKTSDDSQNSDSLQSHTFMFAGVEIQGSPRIDLGVKVLRAFPDRETCNQLMELYSRNSHSCVFHKPSMMACANSVWQTYGSYMNGRRRTDDLVQLSKILCSNSEKAFEDLDDYQQCLVSFTGANLRWEIIGALFGCMTSGILSLPERHAFFTARGSRRSKKQYTKEMKDCVQTCISLSNYSDRLNVQMVALLAKNLILETVISGDSRQSELSLSIRRSQIMSC
jgi:hypothetical protein